jgi:hypothetical protein
MAVICAIAFISIAASLLVFRHRDKQEK